MISRRFWVVLPLCGALLAGCREQSPGTEIRQQPPAAAAAKAAPKAGGAAAKALTGKVLETLTAGRYTYVKLASDRGELWAAVNQTQLRKGEQITVLGPLLMRDFQSKALKRRFAEVYFGELAPKGGAPSGEKGQQQVATAHSFITRTRASFDKPVGRARGGKTISEVFAGRAALRGKQVTVRGKVVKLNRGIMGKNWLHLQDGTGAAKEGDFDLTVTTQATPELGQVVTVEGTLATDKSFGAGYSYAVILEDAAIRN